LQKIGQYWPVNNLPDMMDPDVYETDCTASNGLFLIDAWYTEGTRMAALFIGQSVTAQMGEKTFQALLMSNIETLSAWNAEHD